MSNFTCPGCGNTYPDIMQNEHHIHPLEYGGLDKPENIVILCIACHQLLHYLAYKKANNVGSVEVNIKEYMVSVNSPNINKYSVVLLEYITIVANKYILVKQGVLTSSKDKKVHLELPNSIKELIRIDGKASNYGIEKNIKIILYRYLQNKYPGLRSVTDNELIELLQN